MFYGIRITNENMLTSLLCVVKLSISCDERFRLPPQNYIKIILPETCYIYNNAPGGGGGKENKQNATDLVSTKHTC